jgi:serine/threonine protein kinase
VDIWSLGCVIFWALTKELPFTSTNKLYDFVHETIPFPSSPLENKGVSEECLGFLQRTIAIQPSDRPTAQKALESQWLKNIDAGTVHEESPALVASPPETSEHPQSLPSESSESLDQSKVGKPSPQNAAQEVDSHSEIGDEMTLKPENARLIQTVSPVQEISTAKDTSPVLENQAVENQSIQDRRAQIQGPAQDQSPTQILRNREARAARRALKNDEGYTSAEEIDESKSQISYL